MICERVLQLFSGEGCEERVSVDGSLGLRVRVRQVFPWKWSEMKVFAFSRDGKRVVSVSTLDDLVKIRDVETGAEVGKFAGVR